MWLGSGERVAAPIQKPDLSGQHDMLFNDIYQEVRCAAPSAQVIILNNTSHIFTFPITLSTFPLVSVNLYSSLRQCHPLPFLWCQPFLFLVATLR